MGTDTVRALGFYVKQQSSKIEDVKKITKKNRYYKTRTRSLTYSNAAYNKTITKCENKRDKKTKKKDKASFCVECRFTSLVIKSKYRSHHLLCKGLSLQPLHLSSRGVSERMQQIALSQGPATDTRRIHEPRGENERSAGRNVVQMNVPDGGNVLFQGQWAHSAVVLPGTSCIPLAHFGVVASKRVAMWQAARKIDPPRNFQVSINNKCTSTPNTSVDNPWR